MTETSLVNVSISEEPSAVVPHARICEGTVWGNWRFYLDLIFHCISLKVKQRALFSLFSLCIRSYLEI